jgi:hypothetical protein
MEGVTTRPHHCPTLLDIPSQHVVSSGPRGVLGRVPKSVLALSDLLQNICEGGVGPYLSFHPPHAPHSDISHTGPVLFMRKNRT